MQPVPSIAEHPSSIRRTMRNVRASVARFSRNDAEDILQEAMTRAVRRGVECDAEPWLRLVARRIATDRSRRAREFASEAADLERASRTFAPSPEDIVVANDSAGIIRKALNALPTRYRDALVTYAEEQDHAQVAERFEISPNATWSLLCRARARLRQELHRVGYAAAAIGFRIQRVLGDLSVAGAVTCIGVGAAVVGPATAEGAETSITTVAEPAKVTVTVSQPPAVRAMPARSLAPPPSMPTTDVKNVANAVLARATNARDDAQACAANSTDVSIVEERRRFVVGGLAQLPSGQRRTMEKTDC